MLGLVCPGASGPPWSVCGPSSGTGSVLSGLPSRGPSWFQISILAVTNRRLLLRGPMVKFGFFQFDPSSSFDSLDSILGALVRVGCAGSGSVSWVGSS